VEELEEMRHRVAQRKLDLPSDQRMCLLKNLVQAVIEHEAIFNGKSTIP
jgi:ribosomal protein L17